MHLTSDAYEEDNAVHFYMRQTRVDRMSLEIIHDVETPIFSSSKEISSNATRKEECSNVFLRGQG